MWFIYINGLTTNESLVQQNIIFRGCVSSKALKISLWLCLSVKIYWQSVGEKSGKNRE